MITNNSFLDGTTQRAMRRHLSSTFDRIYIFNLHGDIRSQQANPDDENVFDITQGVSICVMVKCEDADNKRLFYREKIGKRKSKYESLYHHVEFEKFKELKCEQPLYFFKPTSFKSSGSCFPLEDLFEVKSSGIQTKNDEVAISWSENERDSIIHDLQTLSDTDLEYKYPSKKVWSVRKAASEIRSGSYQARSLVYRPFDTRHTALTQKSGGFLGRPRYDVMKHIREDDFSLVVNKKYVGNYFSHVSVARSLVAHRVHYLGNRGQDFACPLYLEANEFEETRQSNLNPALFSELIERSTHPEHSEPDEVDVFDYIYGVLHSPDYRETFAEFLKIDFPRIPWPASPDVFWHVREKGEVLRRLHLMEDAVIGETPYPFIGEGDAVVEKGFPKFEAAEDSLGEVWINKTQRFTGVPEISWGFYIGGYQPAQKWLKDRRGRELSYADLRHYQKIIKILSETDRIMKEIELPLDLDAADAAPADPAA